MEVQLAPGGLLGPHSPDTHRPHQTGSVLRSAAAPTGKRGVRLLEHLLFPTELVGTHPELQLSQLTAHLAHLAHLAAGSACPLLSAPGPPEVLSRTGTPSPTPRRSVGWAVSQGGACAGPSEPSPGDSIPGHTPNLAAGTAENLQPALDALSQHVTPTPAPRSTQQHSDGAPPGARGWGTAALHPRRSQPGRNGGYGLMPGGRGCFPVSSASHDPLAPRGRGQLFSAPQHAFLCAGKHAAKP